MFGLMAGLMCGTGMRLMECVRLRVADADFGRKAIAVRHGKGGKDRIVPLPERYAGQLEDHLLELGHADVSQTMVYTHVLNCPGVLPVKSPADF